MGFLEDHHRTGCPGTGLRRPSPKWWRERF
jgi:hypothetical protein